MAKHDQRILKFLNQNADRAPTITDMMTRLSISISDISDSLSSLQGQGLISMKTNSQGIECWYPASAAALQSPPQPFVQAAPSSQPNALPAGSQPPQAAAPVAGARTTASPSPNWDWRPPAETAPAGSTRAEASRSSQPSLEQPPSVSKIIPPSPATATPSRVPEGEIPSPAATVAAPSPALPADSPFFGLSQPAPKSIGPATLAFGLIAAVGLSAWLGGYMAEKKIAKATSAFADKKSMADAAAAFSAFQESTKSQVAKMESEIKKLSADLVAAKAATDSMKLAEAAKPAPVRNAKSARKSSRSRTRSAAR